MGRREKDQKNFTKVILGEIKDQCKNEFGSFDVLCGTEIMLANKENFVNLYNDGGASGGGNNKKKKKRAPSTYNQFVSAYLNQPHIRKQTKGEFGATSDFMSEIGEKWKSEAKEIINPCVREEGEEFDTCFMRWKDS